MPLTSFQTKVLHTIATNRSPESHVAGGVALNAAPDSPRYSADIDLFHDAEEAVITSAEKDCASLESAGFSIQRQLWETTYRRVWVAEGSEGTKLEWALDSAWRFFPVQNDPLLCWRLHPFDALANKALAMGARAETRDMIDLVFHSPAFPLHAIVWAACGKDPGWTPMLLLEQMRRNARVEPAAIAEMHARIDPADLKTQWLQLAEETEKKLVAAAQAGVELGVVFFSETGVVVWHDTPGAKAHHATLGGALPRFVGFHYPVD